MTTRDVAGWVAAVDRAEVRAGGAMSLDDAVREIERDYIRERDAARVRVDDVAGHLVGDLAESDPAPIETSDVLDHYAGSRVDWAALWATTHDASDWLAEPVLPRGRAIAMYALAKAGKSLLALDIAARLATGRRVLDRPAGDPVRVVYVDAEMTLDDLHDRLDDMGYSAADDMSALAYYLLPDLPPLDTAEGGRDLRALVDAHVAELVVVDTTSLTLRGAENDADTIRAHWRHTGRLLAADGRTVWRLDHGGKDLDRGMRGSSAKAGSEVLTASSTRSRPMTSTCSSRRCRRVSGAARHGRQACPSGTRSADSGTRPAANRRCC